MHVYRLREGRRTSEFMRTLEDVFPFVRMFMDDQHDATIQHVLGTGEATGETFEELETALIRVMAILVARYPDAYPYDPGSKGDNVTVQIVTRLLETLDRLRDRVEIFRKTVHYGGNPCSH